MNHYLDDLIQSSHRILLLQGPVGPFFYNFAKWLQTQNITVFKLNLNAGDEFFYPSNTPNTFTYRDSLEVFSPYLEQFIKAHHIDSVIYFGDTRQYHQIAKQICEKSNIGFWVFEEGYFRPDYITFEKTGVNAFSILPKEADFFSTHSANLTIDPPQKLASGFCKMAKNAVYYYFFANLGAKKFPHYKHHKRFNLTHYLKLWVISFIKRTFYYFKDKNIAYRVKKGKYNDFFIVALQVYNDSQVIVHSGYQNIEQFLAEVLHSFALHAPEKTTLIIKHHPMDRGFINYSHIIEQYCQHYPDLKKRVVYVHDVPMPVFLRFGKGMVTLNSTSGISALLHNMPVKTLGRANYDFVGLTHQGNLDGFWQNPTPPIPEIFEAFRKYHLNKTQINGSFYNKVIYPPISFKS